MSFLSPKLLAYTKFKQLTNINNQRYRTVSQYRCTCNSRRVCKLVTKRFNYDIFFSDKRIYHNTDFLFFCTYNNNKAVFAVYSFLYVEQSRKTENTDYFVTYIKNFVVINCIYVFEFNTLTFDNRCNWNRVNFFSNTNKKTLNNCKSKRKSDRELCSLSFFT